MKNLFEIQKLLTSVIGPSGSEEERAAIISNIVREHADEIFKDSMGNLYVHKKGNGPKIMVAAHMDTLGFIVERIDDDGYVKVFTVGGVHVHALSGARINFANGVKGTFQLEESANVREKSLGELKISDYYVDIGARNRAEAEAMVNIGERGIYDTRPFIQLEHSLFSPYCDDLMGCATIISAICDSEKPANDMYYVFTVQEEVGCRGAEPAAARVKPDLAVVVEAADAEDVMTDCIDAPRVKMGNGPVIRQYDGKTIYDIELFETLKTLADESGNAYQIKCNAGGSNDSSTIQRSNYGVKVACLSIPTKYMHTQIELQNINDAYGVKSILMALAKTELPSAWKFSEEV